MGKRIRRHKIICSAQQKMHREDQQKKTASKKSAPAQPKQKKGLALAQPKSKKGSRKGLAQPKQKQQQTVGEFLTVVGKIYKFHNFSLLMRSWLSLDIYAVFVIFCFLLHSVVLLFAR